MPQWPVPASNAILVAGVPLEMEFEAYTGSAILAGDLVEFAETTNCTIKEGTNDSTTVIGVADLAAASPTDPPRGSNRTTAYNAGDQVKVICGPIIVMLRLAASQNIVCGDHLQPATSGEVKEFVCGTDNVCQHIAQALETITVNTLSFEWVMAKLFI